MNCKLFDMCINNNTYNMVGIYRAAYNNSGKSDSAYSLVY